MSLEQEKPINDLEQPLPNGSETFEAPESQTEAAPTFIPADKMIAPEIEELSIEPVTELPQETSANPTTQTQTDLGIKASELFDLTIAKIDDNTPIAQQIVNKLNEYKKAT